MFGRKRSVHGRQMGDVRSAQQKCIRRGMEEEALLLHFEHLLSTPDMSRAALSRMKVIAAEDIGVGSLGLLPMLQALDKGWPKLDQIERGRRLIQATRMCVASERSRFVPCWAVTRFRAAVESPALQEWRPLDALLLAIDEAIGNKELDLAGALVEEVFLRHPIEKEEPLPTGMGLPREAMKPVWEVMDAHCPIHLYECFETWRHAFGTPSRESVSGRLFLYLALLSVVLSPPLVWPTCPDVSDDEVKYWIERSKREAYELPDWVFDRHTRKGRQMKRGFAHFFEEGAKITNRSQLLGDLEKEVEAKARAIYFQQEALYGKANTAKQRARWRSWMLSEAEVGVAA